MKNFYKKLISPILFFGIAIQIFTPNTCYAVASATADNPELEAAALFSKANGFSNKGLNKKALATYSKIEPKGHDIYFNMGSAAFGAKEYGQSILYWRKAEHFFNFSERFKILSNLVKAKKQLFPEDFPENLSHKLFFGPLIYLKNLFYSLLISFPLLPVQLFFLLCWLVLAFFMQGKPRTEQKKILFPFLIPIALMIILLGGRFVLDGKNYGVVVAKGATLRSGPEKDYPAVGVLKEGDEPQILTQTRKAGPQNDENIFYKVKLARLTGWASSKEIAPI